MLNPYAIRTIKQRLSVPVIVDAGVGTASDACIVMEQGVDGILMNTGIAAAQDPVRMAAAMKAAVESGRNAYLAGNTDTADLPTTTGALLTQGTGAFVASGTVISLSDPWPENCRPVGSVTVATDSFGVTGSVKRRTTIPGAVPSRAPGFGSSVGRSK